MRKFIETYKEEDALFIDGIKLFKTDGWVLSTPASEGAYFEIYSEGKTKGEAVEFLEQFKNNIEEWKNARTFSFQS